MTPAAVYALVALLVAGLAGGYVLVVHVLARLRDQARLQAIQQDREAVRSFNARHRAELDLIARMGRRS